MPNDVVPGVSSKPVSSPILDRFRDHLRIRDEEFRALSYDAPPPTTDEIVRMYEDVLSELTLNSKPIITDLTIIAGEQREHAEGIADVICARIVEVPVEHKLPALYLLDSIVKNIGEEYVRYFSARLPEVFCEAYRQLPPTLHGAIRRLFGTWSTVFSSSVLHRIELELQLSTSVNQQPLRNMKASESPRHAHGIHINPKYVEDVNNVRGTSGYKMYGQKSTTEYDDYESGQGVGTLPNIAAKRLISNGYSSHTSLPLGARGRCSSPLIDEYPGSKSPREIVEMASPSHVGYNYGLQRKIGGDGEAVKWRRNHEFENFTVGNQGNGSNHDRTRALIDAYGQDNGKKSMDVNPHKIGPHRLNGFDEKMVARPWQHTEVEEYNWQDLKPNILERGADQLPGNFRTRPGVGTLGPASLPYASVDDFPNIAEDATALLDAGWGSVSKNFMHDTPFASGASSSATGRFLPHVSAGLRPAADIPKSQVTPLLPAYLPQNQISDHMTASKASHLAPTQHAGPFSSHHPVRPPIPFQQQFLPHQSLSQGSAGPTYAVGPSNQLMNPVPVLYRSMPPAHISISNSQTPGVLPSHFAGHASARPQILPIGQSSITGPSNSPSVAYSGLIKNLVAQGVISLTNQTPTEDSIGVDFDQDLLKVRHESAIRSLYADLPRQCMTCGHRFKTQEEHSKHMDWHVTKNRMAKNRRQNPSRKWYVSSAMWLSSAEALGTDAGPGFPPVDTVEESQEEEEVAVPADENQKTCALCGEPFEDFYSDETDEWMYRGAVFLNAHVRATAGMDISQLGPIVHAKCRSESSSTVRKQVGQEEEVVSEGSQRKRMRI